jgi:tRNA G46 methylase TrmB
MEKQKLTEHQTQYLIHNYLTAHGIIHFETDVMSGLQYFSHRDNRRFAFISHHRKLGYLKGQPDLVILACGSVFFVELKKEDGRQSKEQKQVEKQLKESGYNYIVWKSLDDCKKFVDMWKK